MTAALETVPQLSDVLSGDIPSYVYYDSVQQDLLNKAEAIRSGELEVTAKETANIAQVALLLADVLPPDQAEMLVVSIAAATHDEEAIRMAHREIDLLFEDKPDRCRQSHDIANLTILYTDSETSLDQATVKALCSENEAHGVDLEAPLERQYSEDAKRHERANMKKEHDSNVAASTNLDLPSVALPRHKVA